MAIYTTYTTSIGMATVECCQCHAPFCMTSDAQERLVFNKKSFWCPYCGTSQSYAGSERQRLERELAAERARRDQAEAESRFQRRAAEAAERRRVALKGVVTRTKRRVGRGVCPCCNRHFKELERHMADMHPEYATEAVE